jgi:purine-nucleoside phosphorylase
MSDLSYVDDVKSSVSYLREKVDQIPETAVILGSGLGDFADYVEDKLTISYSKIPGFPVSTVKGHEGNLIFGKVNGKNIAVMQGRFHFYEGYSMPKVVHGVRVLGLLGIKTLVVTNAAGGINPSFEPGDLMVINDHINLSGENPAAGPEIAEFGPRFFDMTHAYDVELIEKARKIFKNNGIKYTEGVYAFFKGPSYETPAEVRMIKLLGADAVGMSTVPEVIAARQMGIKVFGVSCVTNMASGLSDKPLSHQEVVETSNKAKEKFIKIIREML